MTLTTKRLAYLVSRRRTVVGWALARDLAVAAAGILFSLSVTFASGYQPVYQAMVLVLVGVPMYAFLKARKERHGGGRRAEGLCPGTVNAA